MRMLGHLKLVVFLKNPLARSVLGSIFCWYYQIGTKLRESSDRGTRLLHPLVFILPNALVKWCGADLNRYRDLAAKRS